MPAACHYLSTTGFRLQLVLPWQLSQQHSRVLIPILTLCSPLPPGPQHLCASLGPVNAESASGRFGEALSFQRWRVKILCACSEMDYQAFLWECLLAAAWARACQVTREEISGFLLSAGTITMWHVPCSGHQVVYLNPSCS